MPVKGFRKQFCKRGHNTFVTGRYDDGGRKTGGCIECGREMAKKRWNELPLEEKKELAKLSTEWNTAHPERRRKAKWKRRYGISPEQYDAILMSQNGRCAICNRTEEESKVAKRNKTFGVDHDHGCCLSDKTCGKCIRGLLCTNCNSLLGMAKDNIDILKLAILYLEKYKNGK